MDTISTTTAVNDLLATGLTQLALSKLVNCSLASINFYATGKRGKNTSFEIKSQLLKLHGERCKAVI